MSMPTGDSPHSPSPKAPQGLSPVTSRVLAPGPLSLHALQPPPPSWLCRACSFMRSPSSCCSAACRSLSLTIQHRPEWRHGLSKGRGPVPGLPGPGGRGPAVHSVSNPYQPMGAEQHSPHQSGHGGKPAPDIDFHFKAGKKVVRTMQRALSFAQKPEERTARKGEPCRRAAPHLEDLLLHVIEGLEQPLIVLSTLAEPGFQVSDSVLLCQIGSFRTLFAFSLALRSGFSAGRLLYIFPARPYTPIIQLRKIK